MENSTVLYNIWDLGVQLTHKQHPLHLQLNSLRSTSRHSTESACVGEILQSIVHSATYPISAVDIAYAGGLFTLSQ
jgi:hypothetical protein